MKAHSKRNDIQGLRAVAIFSVLLFHLKPKLFPNGFLGVDIFFVLSGYLMSWILSRESVISGSVIFNFYVRRFKRIVPLYALMLIILTLITPLIFIPTDIPHFETDLKWALPFAENMQNVLKKYDYWEQVIIFIVYIFMIFVFKGVQFSSPPSCVVSRSRDSILSNRSFYHDNPSKLFEIEYILKYLDSSRVWQFLVGTIFFELEVQSNEEVKESNDLEKLLEESEGEEKEDEESKVEKSNSFVIFSIPITLILVVISISPSLFGGVIDRQLVTFLTGVLLLIGSHSQNFLLANRVFVYIGDLSYLVYLSHWPVIILYKYHYDISDLAITDCIVCLLLSFSFSIALHHSFEQFFITSSTRIASIFVFMTYSIILILLWTNSLQHISEAASKLKIEVKANSSVIIPSEETIREAIAWNARENKIVYFNPYPGKLRDFEAETWTNFTQEPDLRGIWKGNGSAKVLLIGNSWGYRAYPVLLKLFNLRFDTFRLFTRSAAVILGYDKKPDYSAAYRIILEKYQPDITFIICSDSGGKMVSPVRVNLSHDEVMKNAQWSIDIIRNNSGLVVLDYQYMVPRLEEAPAYTIQKRLLKRNFNFTDLKRSYEGYEDIHKFEIMRSDALIGENLVKNKVERPFCEEKNVCYFYNQTNLHSYFGDLSHLSSEGLKLFEPGYSKIIEEFIKK
ncbi:hypothetical protein PRIPAC_88898 [Pristionchus pacificus]|uniref:Acyltransferase n=1 Tax=Pristionchus pacificus TaxID=54126 RepID=A0A2A6B8A8_PRIPA|nr:hypothetical protein PRIPAC_88898 [Pristionchus pacificus]|eukprot:PDM62097.1 Acyltransferase [Pristionchus pacificus]